MNGKSEANKIALDTALNCSNKEASAATAGSEMAGIPLTCEKKNRLESDSRFSGDIRRLNLCAYRRL